jgi:hypothetical protein
MATEALTCPQCGAAAPTDTRDTGLHDCGYCGARVRFTEPAQPPAPARPQSGPPVVPLLIGTMVFIGIAFGIAGAFIARQEAPPADLGTHHAPAESVVVSQPAPEPAAPPTADFEMHHSLVSVGTNLHVLGMVTNTSEVAVRSPEVHVILLDATGADVHADHGYAKHGFLQPGERSPVDVLIQDAPPHEGMRTEVTVREAKWEPTAAEGLIITPLPPTENRGNWRFAGEVRNDGQQAAQFVKVRITGWDEQDKLVGIVETYAAGKEGMPAGASARYATSHSLWAARPHRFEVEVGGRVP